MSCVRTAEAFCLARVTRYSPMVLKRLIQARVAFAKGYRLGAWYKPESPASPMIDALNIRYILANKAI
jgi:hypothetical protein